MTLYKSRSMDWRRLREWVVITIWSIMTILALTITMPYSARQQAQWIWNHWVASLTQRVAVGITE